MKNPHRISCKAKKRWATWSQAELSISRMRRRSRARGLVVYPCKFCGGCHTGHVDKNFREDALAEIEKPSPERIEQDRERLDVMLKGGA